MTFLLLPYILSVYAFGAMPSAIQEEASQIVARATGGPSNSMIAEAVIVPPSLPDLSEAFLSSITAEQLVALNDDVESLPLSPIETPEPTQTAEALASITPSAQPNSPGIFVLPALPVVESTPAPAVKQTPAPKPSTPTTPRAIVQAPVPTPTPTLYIPPRPSSVPTVNYAAPVNSPTPSITTPYYPPVVAPPVVPTIRPTLSPSIAPVAPVTTARPAVTTPAPAVQVPASTTSAGSGLRGPIMKAVQSDNLSTYYLTYARLGITNVPVNPTDAGNDETWKNTLIKGVGQLLYPPDMGHKTVIFGHSSNFAYVKSDYNYIFKPLYQAKVGDTASLTYQGKQLNYVVKKTEIVPATTASIVTDYGREELVLFTCWPYLTSKDRFIVYLDRV